jgi:hypothetical protein
MIALLLSTTAGSEMALLFSFNTSIASPLHQFSTMSLDSHIIVDKSADNLLLFQSKIREFVAFGVRN